MYVNGETRLTEGEAMYTKGGAVYAQVEKSYVEGTPVSATVLTPSPEDEKSLRVSAFAPTCGEIITTEGGTAKPKPAEDQDGGGESEVGGGLEA